ncbi:MAG: hypothetical protein ABEJ24_00330 [Candidatus Magasanikbacteria bacterium]
MNLKRIITISILSFVLFAILPKTADTQMSGGGYNIYTDKFSVVSTNTSTGGAYEITQTGGQYFATNTKKGSFELRGGFQAQEKGILKVNLSKNTLDLGTISKSNVSKGSIKVTITTDSETGYNLSISENHNLKSNSLTINDVSDGSVTGGSQEYGITTKGADGLLNQDKGISGNLNIASHDGQVYKRTVEVIFKASLSNTPANNEDLSHKVTFNTTVNP